MSCDIMPAFTPLHLNDVLSPDSDIWTQSTPCTGSTVPFATKKDITDAYLLMKRSAEEQALLTMEMHNSLDYWKRCITNLKKTIDTARCKDDLYSHGVASLLQQHLWKIELTHSKAEAAFQDILLPSLDHPCSSTMEEQESDSSVTDWSDDGEDDSDN